MATATLTTQRSPTSFWSRTAYAVVVACILGFLALTTLGMFIYPGGTNFDKTTVGYQFFTNFFSDLGRTVAHNGVPNGIASPLFTLAMTLAGGGLALFFVSFSRLFVQPAWVRVVGLIGTGFGVIAGACFVGVGFTPSNLFGGPHGLFVLSGFVAFWLATLCYIAAIFGSRSYPRSAAFVFVVFAVLLAVYIWLLFNGPRGDSFDATLVRATGQKIIVYASLLSVIAQSLVVRRVVAT